MRLINAFIVFLFYILSNIHETIAGEGLTAYSFLFGMGGTDDIHQIHFKPDDGVRFRKKYEAKHGPRGRYLIEKLGQGYSDEGPSVLDPDEQVAKPPKKKSKRNKTRARSNSVTEVTTDVPSTVAYDSTTNTYFYDSTVETTYDSTTATVTPYNVNDDYK